MESICQCELGVGADGDLSAIRESAMYDRPNPAGPERGSMPAPPSPHIERPGKLVPVVIERIVTSIQAGELPPGSWLPKEADLCDQFGVSRSVIREGLRVLEEKGLIEIVHGRGSTVAPRDRWNLLDPMVVRAQVANDTSLRVAEQLQEVRATVEGGMAARAAINITPAESAELREFLSDMSNSLDDPEAYLAADRRLHEVIHRAADNPFAQFIVQSTLTWIRAAPLRAQHPRESLVKALREHESLVDAICRKSPELAERLMKLLVMSSWERRKSELLAAGPDI